MKEIVISNMMRAKNKQSFFALHQIQDKIKSLYPGVHVEFHILWDDVNEGNFEDNDYWCSLIDTNIENLYSYDKSFFINYVKEYYDLDYESEFNTWKAIYFVLMAHYLRRVKLKHYYLIYDDDVLINDNFKHITDLMLNNIPVLISEPMNSNCDKVMFNQLINIYGDDFYKIYQQRNPNFYGFNAGFQGIDLSIYDEFLSKDRFKFLLDNFQYKSVLDENGNEFFGPERLVIDTQQQSFFGLMNVILSKKNPHILDPNEYYVIPNFGTHPIYGELHPDQELGGWGPALKSKITHFIGHTQGKGKPIEFINEVDKYLKLKNFL